MDIKMPKLIELCFILSTFIMFGPSMVNADLDVDVANSIADLTDIAYEKQSARPVDNVSETLEVEIGWNLVSLTSFDEVNGFIEVSGFLSMEWNATAYSNVYGYKGVELMRKSTVWKPPIVLMNSLEFYDEIGNSGSGNIQFNFQTSVCKWKPWLISKVACFANVQYYPFDKQTCALKFAVWGYNNTEVALKSISSGWGLSLMEENGEWTVSNTSVKQSDVDDISIVEFQITLSRRPIYYIINLIAPVILLGIVNSFAFVLPVASGERVGYSVTCFLAYVVLLNMIMAFLPTTGAPVSYLSYYTFIMMMFSAGGSVMTIFTIRMHHKEDMDEKVPACLSGLYKFCTCKCNLMFRTTNDKHLSGSTDTVTAWDEEVDGQSHVEEEESSRPEITWPMVVMFFDTVLFFLFLGGQIFFTVGYILPIIYYSG